MKSVDIKNTSKNLKENFSIGLINFPCSPLIVDGTMLQQSFIILNQRTYSRHRHGSVEKAVLSPSGEQSGD